MTASAVSTSPVRDMIIIGSGPAGYTAAIYAARADLRPLVFVGAVTAGGALMNTTEVENFPGFTDGIQGPDLMESMRAQAERFGAELVADDVVSVDLLANPKRVELDDGSVHLAKSVVLAMGSGYRRLEIDGEERLSGRGVSWCATCDGFFFRGKDIAVIGGGDSAMEEATFLSKFASSVTVVHRRSELRASKIMADRAMANDKIRFALDTTVDSIDGVDAVEAMTVRDALTGQVKILPVQGVFEAIGHDPRSELVRGQVDLDPDGYVLTEGRSTRTNIPGVFAAGDLVDRTYKQAITAAGSGCAAALDAEHYLAGLGTDTTDQIIGRAEILLEPTTV
jgi:thioredoxin reductase (NADPH)